MTTELSSYPERRTERDQWIVDRRGQRNSVDPRKPYAFFVEAERAKSGDIVPVATIFLTNRECPWRCLMCDLWKNTLTETVPTGAIPAQIEYARAKLPAARQIKLYNSGSFFDPRAIPTDDYPRIARQVDGFDRVIVESHPALIRERCLLFNEMIDGELEVAMGLETAHPQTLERLNKGMSLDQFEDAAETLRARGIDLRVFILVKPPFMDEPTALKWAKLSIDFAFDCGATAVSLIPTRGGNGALEELSASGEFSPPKVRTVEASMEYGLSLGRGRVFTDVWDIAAEKQCNLCSKRRIARLGTMNLAQTVAAAVTCDVCGGTT